MNACRKQVSCRVTFGCQIDLVVKELLRFYLVNEQKNVKQKERKDELKLLVRNLQKALSSSLEDETTKLKEKLNRKYRRLNEVNDPKLFELISEYERKALSKQIQKEIDEIEEKISAIENNYKHAFEWRFEFPEVLDDEGNFLGFDIVIGNPPYLARNMKNEDKKFFKKLYKTAQYQIDLYILFIEKAISLLKENAPISFITPNSWLKNLMMSDCRKNILDNLEMLSINPNISKAFEVASVDTLIFIARKTQNRDFINIWHFDNDSPVITNKVRQNRFYENDKFVFDVEVNDSVRAIMQKIKKLSVPLAELTEISRGINPYDALTGQSQEIIKSRAYHSSYKKDETFVPELKGRHVQSYVYIWDEKHYISYGDWLAAPREPKYFTGERLVLREILGEKFVCAYIQDDFKIDRSLYIAIPRNDSQTNVKFLIAVLSSKLLAWFFRLEKNEFDALFPKIRVEEFRNLPIKKISLKEQQPFIKLVDKILEKKKLGQDTTDLERRIDEMVYRLYDLTDEEITNAEARTK